MNTKIVGQFKEETAANYLKNNGFEIIETNYKCKIGEIDIIARKNNIIRFIEVKYRKDLNFGGANYAINNKKLAKIYKIASFYIKINKLYDLNFSFDCILINGDDIQYLENIYNNM